MSELIDKLKNYAFSPDAYCDCCLEPLDDPEEYIIVIGNYRAHIRCEFELEEQNDELF